MQHVEVRRHSIRVKPWQHLSQAGVNLARRVGSGLGSFDRVITSTIPRACETAIAMGFAVDEQLDQLSEMGDDVDAEIHWAVGFAEFARVIEQGGATARLARAQAQTWRSIARALPDGGRALVITHGGIVEAGAVACLPQADHSTWGPACDYCEGVRLSFNGETFTEAEMLRVERTAHLTEYVMITVCVPIEYTEAVRVAMCEAGAGTVDDGRYDRVTYITRCTSKYRVLDRAWDKAGAAGEEHENEENRIEAICRRERVEAVVKAIVSAHPYETPAVTIYPTLTGEYKYWEG